MPAPARPWILWEDKPYSETYLKTSNNQLIAIFNYAAKYYGLKENPCHKAGAMDKKKADNMLFRTKEEFLRFADVVHHALSIPRNGTGCKKSGVKKFAANKYEILGIAKINFQRGAKIDFLLV